MAVSLEVRVPFLDHRVVELSFNTPFAYKLGRRSKRVLRLAFADLIPPENARAAKRGFSPPLAMWMHERLDRYFDTHLNEQRVEEVGIMSWPEIQRLRSAHRRRSRDNSMQLFSLIMFDRWWRRQVEVRD
jgi:asparagine synthase (glutamine-hydrolysing)